MRRSLGLSLLVLGLSAGAARAQRTLVIVAGDRQTVARGGNQVPGGIATFGPLTVQLRNAAGQPVPNQRVNFSCGAGKPAAMACQLEPAGASSTFGMTDANGMVTAKQMGGNSANAYYASGPMPITVTADLAAPVTFALAVLDAPPPPPPTAGATMQLLNGDNQTAPRLPAATGIPTATYNPLVVLVKDGQGRPAAGVTVTWTINKPGAMACQIEPSGASPSTVLTDGNGVATLWNHTGRQLALETAGEWLTPNEAFSELVFIGHDLDPDALDQLLNRALRA